ncbi:CapA family protein [Calidifontibacter indicus]|uniref:CapA family protein n=1 Tax=Calidifontibacter indicus TaxID=419650 RepID=UPI003D7407F3
MRNTGRATTAVIAAAMAGSVLIAGCSGTGSDTGRSSSATASKSSGGQTTGAGSTTTAAGADELTILFSGDDIPQTGPNRSALVPGTTKTYDFKPKLAAAKPYTSSADLSLCNMEGALSPDNTNLSVGLRHHGPREFAEAMAWMGYDGCSTANNHTFDAGLPGIGQTRQIMADYGLKSSGPGPDAATPKAAVYDVKGVKVAHLSYSYTLDNFAGGSLTAVPASAPWFKESMWMVKNAEGIIADAKAARAGGAQIVMVSIHWGVMFEFQPTTQMVDTATKVLNSGEVDTIIGNHPHVVQKCDRINGRTVYYSLGNQFSDQGAIWGFPDESQDGIIVKVSFKRGADGKWTQPSAEYQVTRVARDAGYFLHLVTPTSNPKSFERESQLIKGESNACNLSPAPATD